MVGSKNTRMLLPVDLAAALGDMVKKHPVFPERTGIEPAIRPPWQPERGIIQVNEGICGLSKCLLFKHFFSKERRNEKYDFAIR